MKARIKWAERLDWLRAQYATRSARSIAEEVGISEKTLKDALHRYGIHRNGEKPTATEKQNFDFRKPETEKVEFEPPSRICSYTTNGTYRGAELAYRGQVKR